MLQPENYLVIDFEATCCDCGTVTKDAMEIIEIGAVMVAARDFRVEGEFRSFATTRATSRGCRR